MCTCGKTDYGRVGKVSRRFLEVCSESAFVQEVFAVCVALGLSVRCCEGNEGCYMKDKSWGSTLKGQVI